MRLYARVGKRAFDVLSASALLIVVSPIIAVIALLLLAKQGRPILFAQERAGKNGTPFTVLKFRTMSIAKPGAVKANRVTRIGRLLRQTSLDELPQLINVVRGDMSVIGPRPLYLKYIPRYSPEQRLRMAVRPGLTGLAQVSGRNSLTWDQKFELDVAYVKSISLRDDIAILMQTVAVVAKPRSGAASTEPSTEFIGIAPEPTP